MSALSTAVPRATTRRTKAPAIPSLLHTCRRPCAVNAMNARTPAIAPIHAARLSVVKTESAMRAAHPIAARRSAIRCSESARATATVSGAISSTPVKFGFPTVAVPWRTIQASCSGIGVASGSAPSAPSMPIAATVVHPATRAQASSLSAAALVRCCVTSTHAQMQRSHVIAPVERPLTPKRELAGSGAAAVDTTTSAAKTASGTSGSPHRIEGPDTARRVTQRSVATHSRTESRRSFGTW